MIVCPECNKEISKDADKCPNCGFPLNAINNVAKCPECGSDVRTTDEKCGTCGYPLKGKSDIKAVNHTDPKKRIIGIALVVVGIVFSSYLTKRDLWGNTIITLVLLTGMRIVFTTTEAQSKKC